jgi:hypothetical protein
MLGLILAIKWVLEFPPSESFNRKVSLESLYPTCLGLPYVLSTRELITIPKTWRDLLILQPYLSL